MRVGLAGNDIYEWLMVAARVSWLLVLADSAFHTQGKWQGWKLNHQWSVKTDAQFNIQFAINFYDVRKVEDISTIVYCTIVYGTKRSHDVPGAHPEKKKYWRN